MPKAYPTGFRRRVVARQGGSIALIAKDYRGRCQKTNPVTISLVGRPEARQGRRRPGRLRAPRRYQVGREGQDSFRQQTLLAPIKLTDDFSNRPWQFALSLEQGPANGLRRSL